MAILNSYIKIKVFTDSVQTNYPQSQIVNIEENIVDNTVNQFEPLLIQIPNLTVDQIISLNNIATPEYLFIMSDQLISVKINGSPSIQIKRLYIDGTSLVSLSISNSSGQLANVRLGLGK